jgi:hypothetical protein
MTQKALMIAGLLSESDLAEILRRCDGSSSAIRATPIAPPLSI